MTKSKLCTALQSVIGEFGIEDPEKVGHEMIDKMKLFLNSDEYDEQAKKSVCSAYLGLCIGHKFGYNKGFKAGIDHIFNYTPEDVE